MYTIEIVWNREFHFVPYGGKIYTTIGEAIAFGKEMENSGDGARVKKFRVVNKNNEVVYPKYKDSVFSGRAVFTCSFCGKTETGKHISTLINPSDQDPHKVSLMPDGWDWDIVPVKFTDLWSCGCHKIR